MKQNRADDVLSLVVVGYFVLEPERYPMLSQFWQKVLNIAIANHIR